MPLGFRYTPHRREPVVFCTAFTVQAPEHAEYRLKEKKPFYDGLQYSRMGARRTLRNREKLSLRSASSVSFCVRLFPFYLNDSMDSFRPDILSYINDLRRDVDQSLDEYSEPKPGTPKRLGEAMRYSLLAPGKRIRPLLTLLAGDLCGAPRKLSMPAACAVEMIHAYSLIHDDLPAMDDDQLRRGRPTCHVQFDEGTAILAGDALLTLAFETLSHRIEPQSLAGDCCAVLSEAAGSTQLVGGQADDLDAADNPTIAGDYDASVKFLESIHLRKTGALLRASSRLGGLVGGVNEEKIQALEEYGVNFGLAFQITDDLLDWIGDEDAVGKRLRKDSEHHKLTFPALLGGDESRCEAAEKVQKACLALDIFKPLIESEPVNAEGKSRRLIYDTLVALARYLIERRS